MIDSKFIEPSENFSYKTEFSNLSVNIGGSLADFVVLDFEDKTVYIVEVTKAYDIKNLLSKVSERGKIV